MILDVEDMIVFIGLDGRDVVYLGVIVIVCVSVFGLNYFVKVSFVLEGMLYYDSEEKVIFVCFLLLFDSIIDVGGFKGNLVLVSGELM